MRGRIILKVLITLAILPDLTRVFYAFHAFSRECVAICTLIIRTWVAVLATNAAVQTFWLAGGARVIDNIFVPFTFYKTASILWAYVTLDQWVVTRG